MSRHIYRRQSHILKLTRALTFENVGCSEKVSYSRLEEIIATTSHGSFPITSSHERASGSRSAPGPSSRVFAGIISRTVVQQLLDSTSAAASGAGKGAHDGEEGGNEMMIDLRPHCDPSPWCRTVTPAALLKDFNSS